MIKNILVTGGAGYIGSATTKDLCDKGHKVTVIDNLYRGKKELVDKRAEFVELDILHREKLFDLMEENKFEAIVHFAGHKDVGESMKNAPMYAENIRSMINILDGIVKYKIKKIIFSSSSAVYGEPKKIPMDESHSKNPTSLYGDTKLICEDLMDWYHKIHDISYTALRYFNVAGDHGLNYLDPHARNLLPIVLEVIKGNRDHLVIFGDDYDTRDGTCIRDYIHVSDLAAAHVLALEHKKSGPINLGTSEGQTVNEVVEEFEKQTGKKVQVKIVGRRKGDPSVTLASSELAKRELGWEPKLGLEDMVRSTLENAGQINSKI